MDHILSCFGKSSEKKLNIPKQTDWNSKYVNNAHKWGLEPYRFLYNCYADMCYFKSYLY